MERTFYFPGKPVTVGDSWKVEGVNPLVLPGKVTFISGFVFLVLTEIREIDGRRCAIVSFEQESSNSVKTRKRENIWIDVDLKGEMVVWLERGYVLSFHGNGSIKCKLKNEKEELEGNGEIFYDEVAALEPPPTPEPLKK